MYLITFYHWEIPDDFSTKISQRKQRGHFSLPLHVLSSQKYLSLISDA